VGKLGVILGYRAVTPRYSGTRGFIQILVMQNYISGIGVELAGKLRWRFIHR